MKIYLMTDIEGVAGVASFEEWTQPEQPYYSLAKKLLTLEVNAAVKGFFAGKDCEIVVADGHGAGGINIELLDERVEYLRGWPPGPYPLGLDRSFDAVAFVGQHAKAGSEYAHLAHTQSCSYLDLSVNGVSIGEFGQIVMCAAELGIPTFFASGDKAFCIEAEELVPGIETVVVKKGLNKGSGDECDTSDYRKRNRSAIHVQPEQARKLIRNGAEMAIQRSETEKFRLPALIPPYERIAVFRPDESNPKKTSTEKHPDSVIALFNMPYNPVAAETVLSP